MLGICMYMYFIRLICVVLCIYFFFFEILFVKLVLYILYLYWLGKNYLKILDFKF